MMKKLTIVSFLALLILAPLAGLAEEQQEQQQTVVEQHPGNPSLFLTGLVQVVVWLLVHH